MDTYVHVAAGAALGHLTMELLESRFSNSALHGEAIFMDGSRGLRRLGVLALAVAASGIASHVILDALPHGDYLVRHGLFLPDSLWPVREFLACVGVFALLARLNTGLKRWLVLWAGLWGAIPDIESLLIALDMMDKQHALLPTTNGTIPHGRNSGWLSAATEGSLLILSLWWHWQHRTLRQPLQRGRDQMPVA